MAKNDNNLAAWVDERIAALEASGNWQPDPARGMARLRDRERTARRHRIEWILATAAGAAACILLVVFSSPGACAHERGCASVATARPKPLVTPAPSLAAPPAVAVPVAPPAKPARAVKPVPPARAVVNFRESGLPTAPIVCEVYTDYQCPACAMLYRDVIPLLMQQYGNAGKVRLVHRDFPLPIHAYARLAARYANAAGSIGHYDVVVDQIFRTQKLWSADGSLDTQVAEVLSASAMQQVRDLVANDPRLDDSVESDKAMGTADRIGSTPTLVIVSGGKRQALAGVPQFSILQAYLDQILR